jgi:hypothetical protein
VTAKTNPYGFVAHFDEAGDHGTKLIAVEDNDFEMIIIGAWRQAGDEA